jgi:AraC-like DNA-binding protein
MLTLEAALRGGAVALYLLLGIVLLRGARASPAALLGGLFALGVAAFAVESAHRLVPYDAPWMVPIRLVSLGNNAVFWLFAAACFDDEFAPSWRHGAIWLGSVVLGAWCSFGHQERACLAFEAAALVFVGLAIRLALAGKAADLVEGRRRFRTLLVIAAALYTLAIIATEVLRHGAGPSAALALTNATGLLALAAFVAYRRLVFLEAGSPIALEPPPPVVPPETVAAARPAAPALEEREEAELLAKLRRVMEEERAYREEGLGIAALAERLGVPEYRLRRLINQRLGHRNFSAFVNGFRLAEAMAALADPAQEAVPVLTIALDAGFQSIGPFNRAFKTATGMTPTEYRKAKLEVSSPSPACGGG